MRTLSPPITSPLADRGVARVAADQVAGVAEGLAAAVGVELAVAVRVEHAVRRRAAARDVVLAEVAAERVDTAVALDVVVARVGVRGGGQREEIGVVAGDRCRCRPGRRAGPRSASPLIVSSPFVPFGLGRRVRGRRHVEQADHAPDRRLVPASPRVHAPLNGSLSRVAGSELPSSRSIVPLSPMIASSSSDATAPRPSPPWSVSFGASSVVGLSMRPSAAPSRRLDVRELTPGAADHVVPALVAGDRVVAGVALEVVVVGVALDLVVAALAVGDVDAVVAVDQVAARGAVRERGEIRRRGDVALAHDPPDDVERIRGGGRRGSTGRPGARARSRCCRRRARRRRRRRRSCRRRQRLRPIDAAATGSCVSTPPTMR